MTVRALRVWAKWTALDCLWVGRCGLIAGLLGAIAVYLFRPGTNPDEAATFVVAPITVFYVVIRLLSAAASRAETQGPAPEIEFRTKVLVWIMFFDLAGVVVGLPSFMIYKSMGIVWATTFTSKALVILVTSAFGLGVMVGTDAVFVLEIGRRLLTSLAAPSRHHHQKAAHC